jgi:outer membrane protein OmpA-like peptidoglycan-associated protein
MKNRFLLVLPLAASMMVPAVAQQSSSDQTQNQQPAAAAPAPSQSSDQQAPAAAPPSQSSDQQAPAAAPPSQSSDQATTSQSSDKQAQAAGASGKQPLAYEKNEGFWGKINPFARKKYVQRQLEPIRGRVNELDELTAQNSKNIKDVDARAQQGITTAMSKATEADQHAVDAGNRANTAQQTAQQATTRLASVEQTVGQIDQYQPATEAEIRFKPGQTVLSKKAKDALDEIATGVKGKNGYIIEVQGFAPGRGQASIENSQRMAQSVVRYLVLNHEIPVYRVHTLGMGNARPASADGTKPRRTTSGRVEVAVLKNGVDQLQGQNGSASMNASPSTEGGVTGTTTAPQQNPKSNTSSTTNTQQPAENPANPK